ncbi:polymorphic toxin type 15 domain-containing protein [Pseudoalteromonas sp. JC3]|uniref:polymorphic toxin type 15 domain-containing protein n=2 Tax=Pseudoalteromonas sp. JC3 TaxID=2810196 RepID=UPI002570C169|nr:polymorphic toxin type 15 domain-containing protein [Pseudoalteromonas sp. JC3]WJE11133.1 polymorphic toxin type 15 domain-containing protein [Pseudoalteromonas sp. JC3]
MSSSWHYDLLLPDAAIEGMQATVKRLDDVTPKIDQHMQQAAQEIGQRVNKALDEYQGQPPIRGVTDKPTKAKADELEPPKGNELPGGKGLHPLKAGMKAYKVPCFKPSDNLRKKHKGDLRALEHNYARQLKNQEKGLNDLTIGEYRENRDRYKNMKRKGTGTAQNDYRDEFEDKLFQSLKQSYGRNKSRTEAKELAAQRTTEIMKNLHALHDPDMGAGGYDKVTRLGDKRVNESIGPQWAKAPIGSKKGDKTRVELMDEQVEKAFKEYGPDAKLNIRLERCPLNKK